MDYLVDGIAGVQRKQRELTNTSRLSMSKSEHHTATTIASRVLPIEIVSTAAILISVVLHQSFNVSYYQPSLDSASFALWHYVAPLIAASILIALTSAPMQKESRNHRYIGFVRQVLAMSVVVYLHFCFKLWAQLINTSNFDDTYQVWDAAISPLLELTAIIHTPFLALTERWPLAYHDLFVGMFCASLALHAVQPKSQQVTARMITSIALVLVIGGLSYSVAPAIGPFIYATGTNATSTDIQRQMLEFHTTFIASNGITFQPAYFVSALAAMPSLHIAHTLVLFWYAQKNIRWLAICYIPVVIFITTEAVMAKWHYYVDLPIGLLVAVAAIYISELLSNQCRGKSNQKH